MSSCPSIISMQMSSLGVVQVGGTGLLDRSSQNCIIPQGWRWGRVCECFYAHSHSYRVGGPPGASSLTSISAFYQRSGRVGTDLSCPASQPQNRQERPDTINRSLLCPNIAGFFSSLDVYLDAPGGPTSCNLSEPF